jgi:hypothetical protein
MIFTIVFPEVLTGLAIEQWRSAKQSVEDFSRLRKTWESDTNRPESTERLSLIVNNVARLKNAPWTMRHAFFADMGGLFLECPDFTPFPIDPHQLFWMVENQYLDYPEVHERTIWDKNKADGFARLLTLVQIAWFLVQTLGRVAQHLALSTIELATLAFIFCTVNTFYFWRHKPLDVATTIVVPCPTPLSAILLESGRSLEDPYSETPLEFVKPPVSRTSLVAPYWLGVKLVFRWKQRHGPTKLPVQTFGNTRANPPRGLTILDLTFTILFTLSYFGIHLVGWHFTFPTRIELMGWRIASSLLLSLLVFYLAMVIIGTFIAGGLAKFFFNNDKEKTILGVARLLPRWGAIALHLPIIMLYMVARFYIIVEGFVSLRTLSFTAFSSVDWGRVIPGT